jgi:hypothetical protein
MWDNFMLISQIVLLLPSNKIAIQDIQIRPTGKERMFRKYSFVISKHNEGAYGE